MRWKAANTDLKYWIQNASGFVHRHGHKYGTLNSVEDAHHAFVNSMYTDLVYFTLRFEIIINSLFLIDQDNEHS